MYFERYGPVGRPSQGVELFGRLGVLGNLESKEGEDKQENVLVNEVSVQKDEGYVYGHDGYYKRYIRMSRARDMTTLYDKRWQKSARKGMQRYL